jgi:hypothetical protein
MGSLHICDDLRQEGFPMALIEAMASEALCVAYDCPCDQEQS